MGGDPTIASRPEPVIRLERGDLVARVALAGATLLEASRGGRPILAPARSLVDPAQSACFPMVPWCDRLSAGGVAAADGLLPLPANRPTTPFPIHGHGWQAKWRIARQDAASVELAHDHAGEPYAYAARLTLSLSPHGLRLALSVTNRGDRPLPYGIGLHPAFPRRPGTVLHVPARARVRFDARGLPLGEEPLDGDDFAPARPLRPGAASALYLDAGPARVGGATLRVSGAFRHLRLWSPEGAAFLCLEPLSHAVDAFSRRETAAPHDLPPGHTLSGWMEVANGG